MNPVGVAQSAPAVRGLLDGGTVLWVPVRCKSANINDYEGHWHCDFGKWYYDSVHGCSDLIKPPVQPGDVVWVKETWCEIPWEDGMGKRSTRVLYRATEPELFDRTVGDKWRSPVTMPHWAARIERTVVTIGVDQRDGVWQWRIKT